MKIYKILLLFFIAAISTFAQVSVKLQQPPPYQFKVEEFWKIVLINGGDRPINVYLIGTATESLQGKVIEATSSIITLQKGVKAVSGRDLGPFSVSESNSRYKDIILNTGGLPSGSYNICIAVIDAADGKQIATDCISVNIENFNRMELVSPMDGEILGDNFNEDAEIDKTTDIQWEDSTSEISKKKKDRDWDEAVGDLKKKKDYDWDEVVGNPKKLTDNNKKPVNRSKNSPIVIFSWLPPIPVPPGARISYRLKIVEIYGNQSVHSAMASNPLYYQSFNLSTTTIRYPIAAQPLMPGRKYAWSVEAFAGDFKIQESEVRSFEIQGGEESKIRYDVSNAGTVQYSSSGFFDKSGLPSGLSSFSIRSSGGSALSMFRNTPPIDILSTPGALVFSGDARLAIVSNSKPPQFSQLPSTYKTLEINPRLSVYDIPFGLNIYLSSLNNSSRQSLNSVSFILDIERLKSKIKERISEKASSAISSADSTLGKIDPSTLNDPSKLVENAEKLGLISPAEKFFLNIKTLGIGRTYPTYSDFTVNGVPVNGLDLGYQLGILYFAVAVGNNLDGINDVSFKRSFLSGQFGFGEKENTHFFLSAVKMNDDPNSIQVSPSNLSLTPQENVVLGSEGKLNLFNKLIEIDGEGAVSGLTRNLNDADFTSGSIPGFINDLLTPKLSTSFDYAWKGKIAFNNQATATYFSLGVNRIGPGFISLGAPNLRQDQFQFDAKFDQKIAEKKITLKTFFRVYHDNLINWKQSTTTTTSFGINLGFYFPKLPFFQINYSPYSQRNDNVLVTLQMKNTFDSFSFMTGYSYQFSGMYASTMFSFNTQSQNSMLGNTSTEFSNTSYMINQNLNFEFPLSLSSTFSLSQSKILTISSNLTEFDLNGSYQLSESISANLGGTISNEESLTKRVMVTLGTNIMISKLLRFQLQGNISNYKDLSGGGLNYNDSMLQASVMLNW